MDTVFQAKKILTMNPSNPKATHVAVSEDRIIAVGSLEDIAGWGPYNLNETFLEKDIVYFSPIGVLVLLREWL